MPLLQGPAHGLLRVLVLPDQFPDGPLAGILARPELLLVLLQLGKPALVHGPQASQVLLGDLRVLVAGLLVADLVLQDQVLVLGLQILQTGTQAVYLRLKLPGLLPTLGQLPF